MCLGEREFIWLVVLPLCMLLLFAEFEMQITHSLGGPTILYFLNRRSLAWKDQFIASFIPIAVKISFFVFCFLFMI
jgi:hypothetical protein